MASGLRPGGASEAAFRDLVETHRADLHAHCYKMLGSPHDADDALQETLLRAWRALRAFRGDSSPRTWLYRIATNVCLDVLGRHVKRVLPTEQGPPARPWAGGSNQPPWPEPSLDPHPHKGLGMDDDAAGPESRYELREALEAAFVAALRYLPPRQRVALLLCDVLGFSAKEAAESVDATIPSLNGALRRARTTIGERLPERSKQTTPRALGNRRLQRVIEGFADAFERGEMEVVLALLDKDVAFATPPHPQRHRGRSAVRRGRSGLAGAGPSPAPRARTGPACGADLIEPGSDLDGSSTSDGVTPVGRSHLGGVLIAAETVISSGCAGLSS